VPPPVFLLDDSVSLLPGACARGYASTRQDWKRSRRRAMRGRVVWLTGDGDSGEPQGNVGNIISPFSCNIFFLVHTLSCRYLFALTAAPPGYGGFFLCKICRVKRIGCYLGNDSARNFPYRNQYLETREFTLLSYLL